MKLMEANKLAEEYKYQFLALEDRFKKFVGAFLLSGVLEKKFKENTSWFQELKSYNRKKKFHYFFLIMLN